MGQKFQIVADVDDCTVKMCVCEMLMEQVTTVVFWVWDLSQQCLRSHSHPHAL